jgi:hypothetical protein
MKPAQQILKNIIIDVADNFYHSDDYYKVIVGKILKERFPEDAIKGQYFDVSKILNRISAAVREFERRLDEEKFQCFAVPSIREAEKAAFARYNLPVKHRS